MRKALVATLSAVFAAMAAQPPVHAILGTAFTYQGELRSSGIPVAGSCDFQFTLFATASGGIAVGGPISVNNVTPASDGRFTVNLDFGSNVFDGNERYLEVAVRSPSGGGAFTILSPRQHLTATPYALQTRGMYVNSAGNVGFGTTSPATNLELSKTNASMRITSTAANGTSVLDIKGDDPGGLSSNVLGQIRFLDDTDTVNAEIFSSVGLLSNPLNFSVDGTVQMALTGTGNLGVGTTLPVTKLQLLGGTDSEPNTGGYLTIGATNAANISIDDNEIMARNNGGVSTLFLNNDGGDVSIIPNANGQVGIGTAPTSSMLTVFNSLFINGGASPRLDIGPNGFILMDTGADITITNGGLQVNTPSAGQTYFNRTSPDGTLVGFLNNGTSAGGISVVGTTVSYNAFTGSHYAWTETPIETGALVSMTGDNRRPRNGANVEPTYGIEVTAKANDAACLGAYLSPEEPPAPGTPIDPNARHLVSAVGNGEMILTESAAGDVKPGDYLISSDVPGCAMKDDPGRFPIGHIVARAAERVNWSDVAPDASGVKRIRVSVLFDSFVRGSDAASLAATIKDQQSQIESLAAQIASMREVTERLAAAQSPQQPSGAASVLAAHTAANASR